jgi:hypothetical protein
MVWILYALIWVDGEVVEKDMGLPYFETHTECIEAAVNLDNDGGFGFCLDEVMGQ